MYKYVLNYVEKISMMFATYFEYYTIILRGRFFQRHTVVSEARHSKTGIHLGCGHSTYGTF